MYGPVPGLPPSPYYRLQVREGGNEAWLDTFTLLTECTGEKFCNTTGMFENLKDWSNSYLNFEMEEGVEVEVAEIVEVEVEEETVEGAGVVATVAAVAEVDVKVVKVMLTCNKDKKHTD